MNRTIDLRFIEKLNPWCVALVFVIANLALKTIGMNHNSFGQDEAWHLWYSIRPMEELLAEALKDPNPPLYNILVGYWVKFFGLSEVTPRFFSIILSSLAAPIIFFVGRKTGEKNLVGILAATFFTFSTVNIFYGQEARVYGLEVFLVSLHLLLFYHLVKQSTWLNFLLLSVVNTLIIYTHLTPIFIFIIQGLFGLYFLFSGKTKTSTLALLSAIIPIIAFIPWYLVNEYFQGENVGTWMVFPDLKEIDYVTGELFNGNYGKYLLLAIALFILASYKKLRFELAYAISIVILGIGLNLLTSQITSLFLTRYLIYTSVAACIVMAHFPEFLGRASYQLKIGAGAITCFIWLLGFNLYPLKLESWREIVLDMKKLQGRYGDCAFVVTPGYIISPISFYFDKQLYTNSTDLNRDMLREYNLGFFTETQWAPSEIFQVKDLFYLTAHRGSANPDSIGAFIKSKGYVATDTLTGYLEGSIIHFKGPSIKDTLFKEQFAIESADEFICYSEWEISKKWLVEQVLSDVEISNNPTELAGSAMVVSLENYGNVLSYQGKPLDKEGDKTMVFNLAASKLKAGSTLKAYIYNPKRIKLKLKKTRFTLISSE